MGNLLQISDWLMLAVLVRVFIIKWVFDFLFRLKKESYFHFQSNNNNNFFYY